MLYSAMKAQLVNTCLFIATLLSEAPRPPHQEQAAGAV